VGITIQQWSRTIWSNINVWIKLAGSSIDSCLKSKKSSKLQPFYHAVLKPQHYNELSELLNVLLPKPHPMTSYDGYGEQDCGD
jgi:hypothetical protein